MRMQHLFKILLIVCLNPWSPCFAATQETVVRNIPLAAPLNDPIAEYSGMTWCGDRLFLIPQYPKRLGKKHSASDRSYFYTLAKQDILDFLQGRRTQALQGQAIELLEGSVRARTLAFDGFEAAACDGKTLWLTIESVGLFQRFRRFRRFSSFLVPADIVEQNNGKTTLVLQTDRIKKLGSQSKLENKGDEALTIWKQQVITFHEVNSSTVINQPVAQAFNKHSGEKALYKFPHIPYRLTDATTVDQQGRFWGINYRYNRDQFSDDIVDTIAQQHGQGQSHQRYDNVERLLEFQIDEGGVYLVNQPPIQLEMTSSEGRNWEAIVRLDDLGFLIATDKYPGSLLGFVPLK
ncbi:MAG: hypothetical protein ACI9FR_000929 [Cryomorphaceae bacterium]|jgi:hypothetical protein